MNNKNDIPPPASAGGRTARMFKWFRDGVGVRQVKRLMVAVIGGTVTLLGIALIVLPGPAFIVIPIGLAILATEFLWAKRLLRKARDMASRLQNKPPAGDGSTPMPPGAGDADGPTAGQSNADRRETRKGNR